MSLFSSLRAIFRRENGESVRDAMVYAGRARLITHLIDEWGEDGCREFSFDAKPAGFDPLLVFEFAPSRERAHWTYSTAGLSLCPAMDQHPPTELVAYSEVEARGLIDLLYQFAFKPRSAVAFRPGDVVSFDEDPPDLGVPMRRDYGLDAAPERTELTCFPDLSSRPEDLRFIMARPGEDSTPVQLLRVVALEDADLAKRNAKRPAIHAHRTWRIN